VLCKPLPAAAKDGVCQEVGCSDGLAKGKGGCHAVLPGSTPWPPVAAQGRAQRWGALGYEHAIPCLFTSDLGTGGVLQIQILRLSLSEPIRYLH
jgi:hypothetical protein